MRRPPLLYALKRGSEIFRESPRKVIYVLQPTRLWSKFRGLLAEGKVKTVTKSEFLALQRTKKREFAGDDWNRMAGGIFVRKYESYQDYTRHQWNKLEELGGQAFVDPARAIQMFARRFADVSLKDNSRILCLGARCGEEVQALRALGHFAVGIDLNPGKDNEYVLNGDFHDLRFSSGSVDTVYTNCLDHALDIDKIMTEIARVLRPDGRFLINIVYGYKQGYTVGKHDTMHWPTAKEFAEVLAKSGGLRLISFRDLTDVGSKWWCQALMIKGAGG